MEGGHIHRFRDTFAVRLLKKGVPIQTVSVLLELNGEDSRILADVGTFRVASEQDLDIDPDGSAPVVELLGPARPCPSTSRGARRGMVRCRSMTGNDEMPPPEFAKDLEFLAEIGERDRGLPPAVVEPAGEEEERRLRIERDLDGLHSRRDVAHLFIIP